MDKKLAAENIRAQLRRRLANLLGCKPQELPQMKMGTMTHCLLTLVGDEETTGGLYTTMSGWLQLLGHQVVWGIEPKEETEASAPNKDEVIN